MKAQALLHPGVLKQAVLGPGLEQALELVFAPRCRWHRGRSVFMHLEGVRPALGGVARHAPADPPDDGGVLGHAVRVGVYLHLVAKVLDKSRIGCQFGQVGGAAVDVVQGLHAALVGWGRAVRCTRVLQAWAKSAGR